MTSETITIEISTEEKPKVEKETHIALVLDESSSMTMKRDIALDAINKQIKTIKRNAKKGGETFVTLITFNDTPTVVWDKVPAKEITKLTREDYNPSGCTALRDATVKAIKMLKSTEDEDINQGYLIAVITDGQENASEISEEKYSKKIRKVQKSKKWTLTYLLDGYSEEEIRSMSVKINVPMSNFAGYQSSGKGTAVAMNVMDASIDHYFDQRQDGYTYTNTFYGQTSDKFTTISEDGDIQTS